MVRRKTFITIISICLVINMFVPTMTYAATKKPTKVGKVSVSISTNKITAKWAKVKKVKVGKKKYTCKYQVKAIGTLTVINKPESFKGNEKTSKTTYSVKNNKYASIKFRVRAYYKKGKKNIYGAWSSWSKYGTINDIENKEDAKDEDVVEGREIEQTIPSGTSFVEDYSKNINNNKISIVYGYDDKQFANGFSVVVKGNSDDYIIKAKDATPAKVTAFFGVNSAINNYTKIIDENICRYIVKTNPYTSDVKVNLFNKNTGELVYANTIGYYTTGRNDMFNGASDSHNPFKTKYENLLNAVVNASNWSAGDTCKVKLQKTLSVLGQIAYHNNQQYSSIPDICTAYNADFPSIDCLEKNNYAWSYWQLTGIRGGSCHTLTDGIARAMARKIDPSVVITDQNGSGSHKYIWCDFSDGTEMAFDITRPEAGNTFWDYETMNVYGYSCEKKYNDLYNSNYWRNWIKNNVSGYNYWFQF